MIRAAGVALSVLALAAVACLAVAVAVNYELIRALAWGMDELDEAEPSETADGVLPGFGAETDTSAMSTAAFGEGRQIATLANPRIRESSGVAFSRRRRDVLWTHNDSGGEPSLFAFDLKGRDLGEYRVQPRARSWDWEDMASARIDGQSYLLVGDIGDNSRSYKKRWIHVVEEPEIPEQPPRSGAARRVGTIYFTYEDGPHDCEGLAVDPAGRRIYLITKNYNLECGVYSLPWSKGDAGKPFVARRVGSVPIVLVTAFDISPEGRRAVALSYSDAFEYVRKPDESWPEAFKRTPRLVRLPRRRQGESVCYGPDGDALYLTSERTPTPLLEVKRKK
jgi:hypothetical protein